MSSAREKKKTRSKASSPPRPPSRSRRGRIGLAAGVLALALAALTAVLLQRTSASPRWNVLLISVDTLRADHLSAYGSRELRTPHIDRLAEEGVLFEDAQTVAPTTLPSHASLFTGLNPPRHGVRDNVGFYLDDGPGTLAERLRDAGYETAAFVGAFVLDSRFGLDRGFALYDDDIGASGEATEAGFVAQRRGDLVLDRALDWLSRRPRGESARPFFAFVHFYDPHAPYEPPGAAPGSSDAERYRGEVAFVDVLVGRLLDWLDEHEMAETTLVALVSDHGESLGEHGELTHGFFLYQSTLAIPLVVRYPSAPAGTRVSGTARLIDVAPTLLDLLGLPPLENAEGASLLPGIERGVLDPARPAYAETFLPQLHFGWSPLRSIRRGADKLILAPRPELYDLSADPGETTNNIEERARLGTELRGALEAIDVTKEPVVAGSLDTDSLERLRSLGYTSSGAKPGNGRFESLQDPKDRIGIYRVVNDPLYQRIEPTDPGFAAALRRLDEILAEDPGVLRAYTLEGELLLKAGRAEEAEHVFERFVGVRNDSFEGQYGLGVARQALGHWEDAVDALGRALAIEPRNTKAHLRMSEVAAARGDVESAESWLRSALEIAPDRYLQDRLAQVLIDAGRTTEARELLSQMASTTGDDPLAAENLGRLLLAEGDAEGAIRELRRAVAIDAENPDAQQALGNALALAGRPEEAVGAFQRAVQLSPCLAPAHANLGSAYGQLGHFQEAVQALEKAIACDPDYASAYRNLAAVQLELEDLPAAIEAMRSAVRARPEDPELRKTLSELEAYRKRY